MTRVEAYNILGDLWYEATSKEKEAINIAQDAVQFVDLMPKDMVHVVRGRWEFVADEYCSTAHCTNCGKGQGLYINGRKPDWNYCPNCGARMDGE